MLQIPVDYWSLFIASIGVLGLFVGFVQSTALPLRKTKYFEGRDHAATEVARVIGVVTLVNFMAAFANAALNDDHASAVLAFAIGLSWAIVVVLYLFFGRGKSKWAKRSQAEGA